MRRKPAKASARRKSTKGAKTRPRGKAVRRATRKAAPKKRRATKRAARKAAPKKRRAAKRVAKKAPAKKRATRRPARRAAPKPLRIVRAKKPAKAPRVKRPQATPAAAFPQRAGASRKQLILFELLRARAALHSAIQGLGPGADEPMGDGKWSVRETVLHLATRDQARLREMEAALRGTDPSWRGINDSDMALINEETLAPLRGLEWEDALRTMHRTRELLIEAVESVPEEPADVWAPEHPFAWMIERLPIHDRHHAEAIKNWRMQRSV